MNKSLLRCILLGLWLPLLAVCATSSNGPPSQSIADTRVILIENDGVVCFWELYNTLEVRGYFSPAGCYSSFGTSPLEQSLSVKLDPKQYRIEFDTRFVVLVNSARSWTGDCCGAGLVSFDLGNVPRGRYSVWLGERRLGSVQIPAKSQEHLTCLGGEARPTATAVPRSSRQVVTVTPTAVTSIYHSPISPLPAPTATPTPLPSPTPIPQAAATPLPDLIWAPGIKPIIIERHMGQWSPAANEILLAGCGGSVTNTVSLAGAPDFAPVDITPDHYACSLSREGFSMLWTPDGRHIALVLPYVTSQSVTISSGSAAMMDRQRDGIRSLNDAATLGRDLELYGWMDDHTLVYDHYAGGGGHHVQALDTRTGERVVNAGIIQGVVDRIGPSYICASTYGDAYPEALAIGPVGYLAEQDSPDALLVHHFPRDEPGTEPITTYCQDWQPGTNNMLVLSARRAPDRSIPSFSALMLWDVDADTVSLLAPDGMGGRFAPDGRKLAYLTMGPARLDAKSRPIPRDSDLSQIVSDSRTVIWYLQLLDLETGRVTLSLPVLDSSHFGYSLEYDAQARSAFSPDSRYLAFFTRGSIKLDAQGHPVGVQYDPWQPGYLNVLDVPIGQVIHSIPASGMLPVWSHDSSQLVYRDEQENLIVLDVSGGAMAPVTQIGGERVRNMDWSFDNRYLSLLIHDLGARPFGTAILQVPSPVPASRKLDSGVWLIRHPQHPELLTLLQLEFDQAKWKIKNARNAGDPVLAHQSLYGCWIRPDGGRGLPDEYSVRQIDKQLGGIWYQITEVRLQEKLVSAAYSARLDDASFLFNVSVSESKETCIQAAEAVLATLRVVPAIDETGGQE